jgi:WD40 repeat protein
LKANNKNQKKSNKKQKLFKVIANNSFKHSYFSAELDNTFIIFKSINEIFYLIYSKMNSIINYDIINYKIRSEIKNAHNSTITNFRHCSDSFNKRDLLLSISKDDNILKIWNITNFECILNLKNVNTKGVLYSACFLKDSKMINFLSTNYNSNGIPEPIKLFDLSGNKIMEIKDKYNKNDNTYFIDIFYYKKKSPVTYIIIANFGYVKSYNFSKGKIYHIYKDKKAHEYENGHRYITIETNNNMVQLIESVRGNINIWDFHKCETINIVSCFKVPINDIILINDKQLLVGANKSIKIVDLKKKIVINNLIKDNKYNEEVCVMEKFTYPLNIECLVFQDTGGNIIIMEI